MFIGGSMIAGCYVASINNDTCDLTLLLGNKDDNDYLDILNPTAVVATICETIGEQWSCSNGLTIMYNEVSNGMDDRIAERVTTILCVMYSIGGLIQVQLFGMLADETYNYTSSLLIAATLPLMALILVVIIIKRVNNVHTLNEIKNK